MNNIPKARDQDESADINKRLNSLIKDSDVSLISNIQEYQQSHMLYMGQNQRPFMNQFEMYFCMMEEYSRNINYLDKKSWSSNRGFQFVIATNSLKQFYSAYILLIQGFYEDSLTIQRSVYESFLRIIFIAKYPSAPANVYMAPNQVGPKFNASNLIKDFGLAWDKYNVMSAFAHSNSYKVMEDMIKIGIEKKAVPVQLDYEQNNDLIGASTNLLLFLCAVFLRAYDELFIVDISSHPEKENLQKHIDRLAAYAEVASETFRGHTESEYWRRISVDTDRLFNFMKSMDKNPEANWQTVWESS